MSKFIASILIVLTLLAVLCFPYTSTGVATFTGIIQNPARTTEKYSSFWNKNKIVQAQKEKPSFKYGDQIATVTIPTLNIYEMPLYYGSEGLNSDWQITTPRLEDNWGTFGYKKPTALGAHNYQLMENLPNMNVGDRFIIETVDDVYVYEAVKKDIYDADKDSWAELTIAGGDYSAILMTCYPIDALSTDNRYLVYGELRNGTIFD